MKIKIELFKDGPGWMSRDNDPETFNLFGTNTLPLPFLDTPANEVLAVIKQLNPDKEVVIIN